MTKRSLQQRLFDRPSPLLKQIPSLSGLLIALGLSIYVLDISLSNVMLVSVGSGLIFGATAIAVWMSARQRYEDVIVMLIPMIDIVALGLFRWGTGGVNSLFGALMLLPVVWLATAPGVRYVALVAVLTSFNYLLPYLAAPPDTWTDWLRVVISPLVFAGVAVVINDLSRQQRRKVQEAQSLVRELKVALSINETMIEKLQEKKKEHQALLDSFASLWSSITAQAIFAIDTCGTVTAWTPGAEQLFGLNERQVLGAVTVDSFFTPTALAILSEEFATSSTGAVVAADGSEVDAEIDSSAALPDGVRALFAAAEAASDIETILDVASASGRVIPARVTITQRLGADGNQLGYLLVITDESRAVEVARMKDEFVGMVSHELRTPLSSIIGFLDLLQNDPEQPLTADQLEFVEVINRNANRLLALVGDLLFTAQAESGSFPLALGEFDLTKSVAVAVQSASPIALRAGVELESDTPDEPLMICADATRIGQALDNLLSNALKFTPAGGRVVVGARSTGENVDIWVRDTGLGIPKAEQEQLFTRFFRASTATRNAVPGIGLGLNIIRAIVIAHHGKMSVTSAEGEGTEFNISLPRESSST